MLPVGSISQIINFFINDPNFSPAMEEALCDFFEVNTSKELGKLRPSKMATDFFNEWLVFDCYLDSKRTVLEEYLFVNQDELSREYKNLYSDLILTQNYSLYRYDSIALNKSISVTDVLTDKKYFVSERKATHEAVVGNYSFWRIASVGGQNEIISADGFQIPADALPLRQILDWKKREIKFNPLVVYQQILKPIESD